MQGIRASSTLTVSHDGQFWVGVIERSEDGQLSACRVVFGAEPSDEQIAQFICARWRHLRFSETVVDDAMPKSASNPKRRQREIAKELEQRGPSTKAQQALSQEREAAAENRKSAAREKREQEQERRFELRQEKRKQKHRGK